MAAPKGAEVADKAHKRLFVRDGGFVPRDAPGDGEAAVAPEVQCCKRALTSLKYFCEEAPDLPVAAAGSLLGVAIRPADSGWPVGKVRTMTLAPMDFLEFLDAVGEHRLLPEDSSGGIVAVEAKSGTSVKAKNLGVFLGRYPASRAIRISEKNFGTPGPVRSVPLYAASFVE